jgi:hypothetical protein
VWITSWENRGGGQDYRSYLYSVDVNGQFLFGVRGIPNVGGDLTPTSNGMIAVATDYDAPATHVVAKRIHTSGRILWQSPVALAGLGGGVMFYNASCSSDGGDGAVVALGDYRYDFCAQRVLSNGMLGSPPLAVLQHPDARIQSLSADRVSYILPQAGNITLDLFDLLGRRIATLQDGFQSAGSYITRIDKPDLPSGVYLVRLDAGGEASVGKIAIIK